MSMTRKRRTVEELHRVSEHLQYEISMLQSMANGIASGVAGQGPIANALIESFVIHVRNMLDFLYAEDPRPDDVIAEDFFDTREQWTKDRPALSQLLSGVKWRAGKEVAHLTYARLDVTPIGKPWRFVEIANEIAAVISMFSDKVPRHKISGKTSTAI